MQLSIKNLSELPQAATQILKEAKEEKIFLFYGEMGAGKTTLIKELCKQLGTTDHTSSPTFSIINEYKVEDTAIFHFDFYRLKNQNEAFDLGYEDYFFSNNYCMIEWPEKIPDLIPQRYLKVEIKTLSEKERLIEVKLIQ